MTETFPSCLPAASALSHCACQSAGAATAADADPVADAEAAGLAAADEAAGFADAEAGAELAAACEAAALGFVAEDTGPLDGGAACPPQGESSANPVRAAGSRIRTNVMFPSNPRRRVHGLYASHRLLHLVPERPEHGMLRSHAGSSVGRLQPCLRGRSQHSAAAAACAGDGVHREAAVAGSSARI